jgi:hypothetical protein
MSGGILSRSISGAALAALAGELIYRDQVANGVMGKEQYLHYQAERFDLYLTHPKSSVLIVSALAVAGFLLVYELVVASLSWLIDRSPATQPSAGTGPVSEAS